jgi:small subunit ribosomal protein S6
VTALFCANSLTSEAFYQRRNSVRERVRRYELMIIISPLHSDEESATTIMNRVQEAVEAANGAVLSVQYGAPWGRRKFAYPIRAYAGGESSRRVFNEGFYVLMNLTLPTSQVAGIERTIKLIDPILRYLLILVEGEPQLHVEMDGHSEGELDEEEELDEDELDEDELDEDELDEDELDEDELDEDELDEDDTRPARG